MAPLAVDEHTRANAPSGLLDHEAVAFLLQSNVLRGGGLRLGQESGLSFDISFERDAVYECGAMLLTALALPRQLAEEKSSQLY